MARHEAPGWYGKLATQGDFASRRLPQTLVSACDEWLSACVADSNRKLGAQWLQTYLSAPMQRFAWGPGVADAQCQVLIGVRSMRSEHVLAPSGASDERRRRVDEEGEHRP